jgi:Fe2+ or Zn2+ uptake regulation protein
MRHTIALLRQHGIRPTPQRLAVAQAALAGKGHPSAEDVLGRVRRRHPTVSRATVYNTLNLFVEKGLLKQQWLTEGNAVFDAEVHPHHHFIDNQTGEICDVPWEFLRVTGEKSLREFEVTEVQVVLRGRRRKR